MRILITGVAGFIGFHAAKKLLEQKKKIFGIDNINNYYDIRLKKNRLNILRKNKLFNFCKIDIKNYAKLFNYAENNKIDIILHLAAQAGVRYSLENPKSYIDNNIYGFFNILELSKNLKIKNLIFASTSSVYGLNQDYPLREDSVTDHPIQFYAATKKSNEVMAHSYSYLYNIPITCLRFFTVYGPWGRPDMALFKFVKNILENKNIEIFNHGKHSRDFTYIDDVVDVIKKLIHKPALLNKRWNKKKPDPSSSICRFRILNVSNGTKVSLMNYLKQIENILNLKAKIKFLDLQKGDIKETLSSKSIIKKYLKIKTPINYKIGIKNFIYWYKDYYNAK